MNLKNSVLFVLLFVCACSVSDQPNASMSPASKQLPEPGSDGEKLLKKYCTSCHGAPQPNVHKAEEWPNVVFRMNNKRIMRALGEISEQDVSILTAYLGKYAK